MSIVIGGDVFPSDKNRNEFLAGDIDSLFDQKIQNIIKNADFSFCNLEGALTKHNVHIDKVMPVMKEDPSVVSVYKKLGITCVGLANNHAMDFGKKGFEDTCNVLKENGIDYFGVGENENSIDKYRSLTVDGKKVAVYLVAETLFNEPKADYPGANVYDEYLVCKEIEALKKEHDYVLVLYHGGMEFYWYNTDRIRKRFHRMADSGADFVVAQHTHNIGLKEDYNGAYLLYGQGNFLFGNNVTEYNKTGLLLEFTFEDGMKIKEHLVRHEGGKAYLDPNPDWSAFEKRNQEYREGNEFRKEYSAYCEHIMLNYIRSFRGINFVDRMVKKFCSDKTYKKFIYRHYTRKHLLRMYSILKCDEHNEIMTTALYDMIQNTKKG